MCTASTRVATLLLAVPWREDQKSEAIASRSFGHLKDLKVYVVKGLTGGTRVSLSLSGHRAVGSWRPSVRNIRHSLAARAPGCATWKVNDHMRYRQRITEVQRTA